MLVASTCKKEDAPGLKSVQLDNPFEISVSEQAIIHGSNTVMEITDISDSRCPADVQCFWAGNTKVKLNVSGLGVNDILLNFCIGQCDNRYRKADTLAMQYQNQSYSIILSEVKPYPGTGSEKKTAVFIIRKD
ncbi:MAG TPA: hypothetical protein VLZ28_06725 [Daejeonella sp.]|nr:hypothetical protein [Daejeonella sp.]